MEPLTFSQLAAQATQLVLILITLAVFIESIVEAFQPFITKIVDISLRTAVNILAASIVGTLAAWGMGLQLKDYLTFIPPVIPAYASYVLLGVAAGAGGSRFWHAVLGFLAQFKFPVVPVTK
jgi:hypothetical protein